MISKTVSPEWMVLAMLVLIKLLIHGFAGGNYELHRDAFLYLAMGDHPAFGYVSVPPFTGLLALILNQAGSDGVFWVRLLPALAGAASLLVIGLLVKEFGGRTWAVLIAGLAFLLSPAFLRSNVLFQPVSFNQFFWLLSAYFMVRMLKTKHPRYWLHLGILWGVAFLNKYSIVFLALGFVIALALTPARGLFRSRYLLYGALAGLAITTPNLIWQYAHNWPVITHMRTLHETQLVNVNITDFLMMQFLMNFHALAVWLAGLIFLLFLKAGKPYRALGYTFLAVLAILILLQGKHYYSLGLYTPLFAAGGFALEQVLFQRYRFLKPAIAASLSLLILPLVPFSLPVLSLEQMVAYGKATGSYGLEGALRWEDGRVHSLPQDYADMTGWQELGVKVTQTYLSLSPEEQARCMVYAENYGEAGAIRYYGRQFGLPEPVSFSDNFLLWAPDSIRGDILIYVNDEVEEISYFFSDVRPVGRINDPFARESGLPVYLCRAPRNGFDQFYQAKVAELKAEYQQPGIR